MQCRVCRATLEQQLFDQDVGTVRRYTWKGWLSYRLVFDMWITRVEPLIALEGEASGDVEGIGRRSFSTNGRDFTVVRYDWCVRTNRERWPRKFRQSDKWNA